MVDILDLIIDVPDSTDVIEETETLIDWLHVSFSSYTPSEGLLLLLLVLGFILLSYFIVRDIF